MIGLAKIIDSFNNGKISDNIFTGFKSQCDVKDFSWRVLLSHKAYSFIDAWHKDPERVFFEHNNPNVNIDSYDFYRTTIALKGAHTPFYTHTFNEFDDLFSYERLAKIQDQLRSRDKAHYLIRIMQCMLLQRIIQIVFFLRILWSVTDKKLVLFNIE